MKLLRRHAFSINTILLTIFSLVVAAMVILVSIAVNHVMKNTLIRASVDSSDQLVSQSQYTLNRFFFRINSSLYSQARSSSLVALCKQAENGAIDDPALFDNVSQQIDTLLRNQEDISNIFVLSNNACIYQYKFANRPFLDAPLIQELFDKQKIPTDRIIAYHPVDYPTYYSTSYLDKELEIPISLLIQDSASPLKTNHGILLATLRLTVLDEFFAKINSSNGLIAFILEENGDIFYSSEHDWIGKTYEEYLSDCGAISQDGTFLLNSSGQQILLEDSLSLNFNDWVLVLTTDLSGLNNRIKNMQMVIFASAALALTIAFGLICFFTQRITAPLASLSRQMEHLDYNSLSQKVSSRYSYREIRQLYNGYNRMLDRIEELIDKVYYEQLRQKEAQYEALQAKINPHFLYNTLQSISALAILNRNEDIETVTNALGSMLEYLTYEKSSEVLLSKDLDYIKNYVQIQQLRYNNRFIVGYEIDSRTLTCHIQKLLLQPMVENAIKHGLEQKESGGRLFLRTFLNKNLLIIEVQDNGAGMDEETLHQLIQSTNSPDKNSVKKSIGLSNVQERIHLKYGTGYGMTIQSTLNQGTTVTVTIPAIFTDSKVSYEKDFSR